MILYPKGRGLNLTYLGVSKVEVDGFGVTDMQDSIRLGGKPGAHLRMEVRTASDEGVSRVR